MSVALATGLIMGLTFIAFGKAIEYALETPPPYIPIRGETVTIGDYLNTTGWDTYSQAVDTIISCIFF